MSLGAKLRLCVRNFKNDMMDNVFAPVVRIETFRNLMAQLSEHPEWDCWHGDICNAFCSAPPEKSIYVHMPDAMIEEDPSLKGKYMDYRSHHER